MKLSEIKLFNYFKHNGKILQLIDHDFLDQWAVGYDNQTDETINMNICTEVEPVQVSIAEINMPEIEQLQARIKELESDRYVNKIKAQGVEEFIEIETNKSIKAGNSEIFRSYTMVRRRLCAFLNKLRANNE